MITSNAARLSSTIARVRSATIVDRVTGPYHQEKIASLDDDLLASRGASRQRRWLMTGTPTAERNEEQQQQPPPQPLAAAATSGGAAGVAGDAAGGARAGGEAPGGRFVAAPLEQLWRLLKVRRWDRAVMRCSCT